MAQIVMIVADRLVGTDDGKHFTVAGKTRTLDNTAKFLRVDPSVIKRRFIMAQPMTPLPMVQQELPAPPAAKRKKKKR